MIIKVLNKNNSDVIGAAATTLCLIHCIATPFLFIAHVGSSSHHHDAPFWWTSIDVIFIAVSFFAVLWSVKNTSKNWIKIAFWLAWTFLTLVILNEKLEILHLVESVIYIPALSLVGLHIYNKSYCRCEDELY